MDEHMTMQMVRAARQQMEFEILRSIATFQRHTRLTIGSIELTTAQMVGDSHKEVIIVHVRVEMP